MFKTYKSLVWMVAVLLLVAAPVIAQDVTPAVEVSDQAIENGTVTVDRVVSDGPGWIVIHADNNGAPGAVVGWSAVTDGENIDVAVEIDMDTATATLYAMLHADLGTVGTYEFPGADEPVMVGGQVLTPAFTVTGLAAQATATAQPTATAEATATAVATATTAVTATTEVTPTVGATVEPEQLPETGGSSTPWTPIVLVGLGLVLLFVGSFLVLRRTADINIKD